MATERRYRRAMRAEGLVAFQVKVETSDLQILAERNLQRQALVELRRLREELEEYIRLDPAFAEALTPYELPATAPLVAKIMAQAATACGVGPMAAVAGAFAEIVGRALMPLSHEVRVENGGDCFLAGSRPVTVGIFAGASPLSGRLGLKVAAEHLPCGVCTSSGTVGPSLSFGKADAAVICADSAALADACATAVANKVQSPADFEQALDFARRIKDVWGALVVKGDQMAAWGKFELVPLQTEGGSE